jgi:AraC family transcriptional regulator, alkane utilization regulator
MDALSEVLGAIHLDGAVFLDAEFTAPWCVEAQYGLPKETQLLRGADHIALFHFLLDGSCKTRLADGGEVLTLGPGDFVLYPHDHKHILGSDLSLPAVDTDILPRTDHGASARMIHGGGGEATRFVCGYLACDRRISRSLFSSLPQLMRIPMGSDPAMAWLTELLRVGVNESQAQRPGARSLLTKLSELVFVEAMRRYAAGLPQEERGWLAGLRDPQVGKALALLHAEPGRPWTVEELAREAALSRSSLGQRFVELIGEPPMQYLTHWRLALAARALRSGSEPVNRIAERHGYESEAAFNRAFRREFGMPPASWRRQAH